MDHQSVRNEDVAEDPDSLGFTLTDPSGLVVDIAVQDDSWQHVFTDISKEKCTAMLVDTVTHEGYDAISIAVLLSDDETIADLNKTHRDKDGPTDVLSFPDDDDECLGDIALAYGVVSRQAEEMGISIIDHVLHLMVHGTLHLCGHDHLDPEEAEVMEGIEIDILAKHGVDNPYALPLADVEGAPL